MHGKIEIEAGVAYIVVEGVKRLIPDGAPIEVLLETTTRPGFSSGIPGAPRNATLPEALTVRPPTGGSGGMAGGLGGMFGGPANVQNLMNRIMSGPGGENLPPAGSPVELPGVGNGAPGAAGSMSQIAGMPSMSGIAPALAARAKSGAAPAGGGGKGAAISPDIEAQLPPPMARFTGQTVVVQPGSQPPPSMIITVVDENVPAPKPEPKPVPMEWVTGFFVADRIMLTMTSRPPQNGKTATIQVPNGSEVRMLDTRPETRKFTHQGYLKGSQMVPRATAQVLWPVNILIMNESPANWQRAYLYWYASAKIMMALWNEETSTWFERELVAMHMLVDVAEAEIQNKLDVIAGRGSTNASAPTSVGPAFNTPSNASYAPPAPRASAPAPVSPAVPTLAASSTSLEQIQQMVQDALRAERAKEAPVVEPTPEEALDAAWAMVVDFFGHRAASGDPDAKAAVAVLDALSTWERATGLMVVDEAESGAELEVETSNGIEPSETEATGTPSPA